MTHLRRIVAGAAAGPVAAVMLVVSMGLGSSLPGARLLPSVPALAGLDYSAGALVQVAPLRDEFLRESLGRHLLGRFVAGSLGTVPPTVGPGREGDGDDRPRGDQDDGSLEDILSPSDLRIEMEASRSRAARGDRITYTITVTNVGEIVAKGVRVLSHVPEHTTYVAGEECGGETVRIEDNDETPGGKSTCIALPVGPPARGGHAVSNDVGVLDPGENRVTIFSVTVGADAPDGTIANHAHVDSQGSPRVTSNRVATHVS